jgi:hypothetical protein
MALEYDEKGRKKEALNFYIQAAEIYLREVLI